MRKTLIASSIAAVTLVGLAGGAAFAAESSGTPEATPTTAAPGTDIFSDMGVTPEQGACLVANVGSVDTNDLTALMELMTECGISADQLLEIDEDAAPTTNGAADTPATASEAQPGTLDGATVAAVFEIMGLDQATVDCLVEGAATAAPTDDQSAELVFIGCGVGPLVMLDAIVALHEQTGATSAETTTVAGASATTVAAVGNPMVDLLLEQLAAQGINLDAAQGQCILDNISDFDPNDMAAVIGVLDTCGIDIADLIPSG